METGKIPADLRYTKTHEWIRLDGKTVTMGITDHAQSQLTDIVFVDLPAVGKPVVKGKGALVLESVKTVADVYAPGDGKVAAANTDLKTHPELVNQDPYGKGWIVRIELAAALDTSALLTPEAYKQLVETHG